MKDKGFTLIELLVVIAIIGVLATVILNSLGESRIKARDVRTSQVVQQMATALELFYSDNGYYPLSRNGSDWIGVCASDTSVSGYYNEDFYNDLAPYMKSISLFENCQDIYYYSGAAVQAYYANACKVSSNTVANSQGYIIAYSMVDTIHNQYFYLDYAGLKYHCRGYGD